MAETPKRFFPLLAAEGVMVGRWVCRGENRAPGPEQHTFAPTINVPLHGVYARHGPHGDQLLDPMTASLSNHGEVWRGSHPGPCGDEGVYVLLDPGAVADTLPSVTDGDATTPFARSYLHLPPRLWLAWVAHVADLGAGVLAPDAALDTTRHLVEQLGPTPTVPAHARELACRAFRRATGTTIHAWDEGLRLRRAALRLRAEPRVDLTTLALDHGFASHAHFTTRFGRAFGLTPSSWRARS